MGGGQSVAALECANDYDPFKPCILSGGKYHARTPNSPAPEGGFPTVVILHDAGGSGREIAEDKRLVDAFTSQGFAVIAPDGLPRKNLRFRYSGSTGSSMTGLTDTLRTKETHVSKKKFYMIDFDGSVRVLKWKKDTGWYFYSIDRVQFSQQGHGQESTKFRTKRLGRDEIRFLREVLAQAKEKHGINPKPVLIIGVGHGGSLVWQIACHTPGLGEVLAPVDGAYWHAPPTKCRPGAKLVHTHDRNSKFWPLKGAPGRERRFSRPSIARNISVMLKANECGPEKTTIRDDDHGFSHTKWTNCQRQNSTELMLIDEKFAFQDWWIEQMLDRVDLPGVEATPAEPEVPTETGPRFKSSGAGTGFLKPGGDTGSRFKRAK